MTTAEWIRSFVQNHPLYQHDSRVSDQINYDLMKVLAKMTSGQMIVQPLTGDLIEAKKDEIPE